jgi:outer membrane protein assembly factor BamB
MTRFRKPRRWLLWVAVAAGVVVIAAGVAAYAILTGGPGDVSNPDVEFTAPTATQQAPAQPKTARDPGFEWPVYGYDKQRTRYLPLQRPIHPPYRRPWNYRAGALLEFPPALSARSLFLLKDDGMLVAIGRRSGHVVWGRKLGHLAASSPAVAGSSVYAVILERGRGIKAGRVVALNVGSGRTRWSHKLASRAESSPLIDKGTLYFGTENGSVYALRTSDGSLKWRYRAAGAVKGGLALDRGRLFFGDYAGKIYAIRASNGHQIWRKNTSGARYGLSSGQFYATPAVAYGRVYMGNTDGFVYSYAASSGKLAWRIHTGGYVYGSAAVAQVPGGRPTVYIGSYDRRFYALDARSGRKLWVRNAGGRVSGGAVVIGDTVWFSTLEKQTRALGARTGNLLFKINRGQFNPVVSDGQRIYLVGHASLTALEPRTKQPATQAKKKAKQRKAKQRKAKRQKPRLRHQKRHLARSAVVCFRHNHKRTCRHRRPKVCYRSHGHTKCHAVRRKHHRARKKR